MTIQIPDSELEWRFGTSGGPGGQHANRSNTRAELSFSVAASTSIPDRLKGRLVDKLGEVVRVVEDGSRSQHRNREVAVKRLHALLEDAAAPDAPPRRRTRPSRRARERRLSSKRLRSRLKESRRRPTKYD